MPFVANTQPGGGERVEANRVNPGRGPFYCRFPDCGRPMGVKISSKGRAFFAHNPGQLEERCERTEESYEHQKMKSDLRRRFLRWGVECEEEFRNEGGVRRFDLLVANTFAIECQVSAITATEWISRIQGDAAGGYFTWWVWHASVLGMNLDPNSEEVGRQVKVRWEALKKCRRMGDGWVFVMDSEDRLAEVLLGPAVRGWCRVEAIRRIPKPLPGESVMPPTVSKVSRFTLSGGPQSPRVQLILVTPLGDRGGRRYMELGNRIEEGCTEVDFFPTPSWLECRRLAQAMQFGVGILSR